MHPVFFSFPLPQFLYGFFSESFTVFSYGFFIAVGAVLGVAYTTMQGKKHFGLKFDDINTLFILLIIAAFFRGKFFLIFENPSYYLSNPAAFISGTGFVFYGSLLFCIPVMLIYFKQKKLPVLHMLDIMAITTCIVHFFGRLGCFMAGCCYGIHWQGPLAVVFTDPLCMAPLNEPLHPTQLYSAAMIGIILIILLIRKQKKKFHGQIFLIYLMSYPIGRSMIEMLRGDTSRGYVFQDLISNAQFISLIVFFVALYFYRKLSASRHSLLV